MSNTFKHIEEVRSRLEKVIVDLRRRQYEHDFSKLQSPEKEIFDKYSPNLATTTYGSEEYKPNEELKFAQKHHYEHNSHHPEHFSNGIRGMNLLDIVEMLCDWKASTLRHNDGDIRRSIEINQKRFGYSDELKQILFNTLEIIES